jgi:transposase-like protein
MATTMDKRKFLCVEEKVKVVREIASGKKKADTCRQFGLVNSTIQTICEKRTKIISVFEQNGSRIKRLRKLERSDVAEALLKRFKQRRSDNVLVSSPVRLKKMRNLRRS